jgi:hypothetical protein
MLVAMVVIFVAIYSIVIAVAVGWSVLRLAVLVVAWCVLAASTAVLALVLGCQKLIQVTNDWRWRRRYGEILPPE